MTVIHTLRWTERACVCLSCVHGDDVCAACTLERRNRPRIIQEPRMAATALVCLCSILVSKPMWCGSIRRGKPNPSIAEERRLPGSLFAYSSSASSSSGLSTRFLRTTNVEVLIRHKMSLARSWDFQTDAQQQGPQIASRCAPSRC